MQCPRCLSRSLIVNRIEGKLYCMSCGKELLIEKVVSIANKEEAKEPMKSTAAADKPGLRDIESITQEEKVQWGAEADKDGIKVVAERHNVNWQHVRAWRLTWLRHNKKEEAAKKIGEVPPVSTPQGFVSVEFFDGYRRAVLDIFSRAQNDVPTYAGIKSTQEVSAACNAAVKDGGKEHGK